MKTQTLERIGRERCELIDRLNQEYIKHSSNYSNYREEFKCSLIFGLGLPALLTGFSYLLENSQPIELGTATDLMRQMSYWAYMAVSPFVIINGMGMQKARGAMDVLTKVYREIKNPVSVNPGCKK